MEMTRYSQVKGSEEEISYTEKKESARALELAKFKLNELRERINKLGELLQKKIEGCGWRLRKKSKWPIRKLQERNLKYNLKVQVKGEEKLKEAKYGMGIHYCEHEQGSILGEEEEDTQERYDESIINYWESLDKHEETKSSEEAIESDVFKTNGLCVIASYKNDKDGHPYTTVINKVKGLSPEDIKKTQNQNFVKKENAETLSNIDNQSEDYTQLVNAIVWEEL